MIISSAQLSYEAASNGFRPDILEKVAHLLNLLNALRSHPYLKGKFVLKGGTALNLFIFDVPRLSVDIDLNYIGEKDREMMLKERPKIEKAIHAVFSREGFQITRTPEEHAGGKWLLRYQNAFGGTGNLEVDINFMFRIPLWPIVVLDSKPVGSWQATGISVLDIHELAAGKLAALLSRQQARDLFDCHRILHLNKLDLELLRIAFVVYGAMNRKDWRSVSIDDVDFNAKELANQLIPTLRSKVIQEEKWSDKYGLKFVQECRKALSAILPFTNTEQEFLYLLLEEGVINSTLLTTDTELQNRIQKHPLLEWKAYNVRRHKGLS